MNTSRFTKRTALIVIIAVLVVMAAGSGVVTIFGTPSTPQDTGTVVISNPTTTPTPPTTTRPPGAGSESGPGTTRQPTSSTVNATLDASVSDFDDVRTSDGEVHSVIGRLSGTLDWSNDTVDRAELVVRTWIPGEGWRTVERTTVVPSGTNVSLDRAIAGEGFVYATGENASVFSNPEDGTTVVRDGFVSVTAKLYDDGDRVDRIQTIEGFSFGVTNLAESSSPSDGRPSLVLHGDGEGGDPTVFTASNVAPTVQGEDQFTVSNAGTDDGVLQLAATDRTSAENGFTEPESHVDGDTDSELPSNLLVRVSLHQNGTTTYVVGDADEMVSYASLDTDDFAVERSLAAGQNVTVVVEWYIPRSAGNEIQSDSVSLDFRVSLSDSGANLFDIVSVDSSKDIGGLSRHVDVRNPSERMSGPTNGVTHHHATV